jgi:hypothetical protein
MAIIQFALTIDDGGFNHDHGLGPYRCQGMNTHTPPLPHGPGPCFDLLTALLDSWTVWNAAAGSEAAGRDWRAEYLRLTYGCGAYQPMRTWCARRPQPGPAEAVADRLEAQWEQLQPWDGARELLAALRPHCRLAVVTNCSERLGQRAAALLGVDWDVVVTSEAAGFYKPDPGPTSWRWTGWGCLRARPPSWPDRL